MTYQPRHAGEYVVSDNAQQEPDGTIKTIGRFTSEKLAAEFISTQPDALTGRYNLDGPSDDEPLTELALDRTVTIGRLVEIARGFGPDGDGHDFTNLEYTRAQVELIADAAGLDQDSRPLVLSAIMVGRGDPVSVIKAIHEDSGA